MTIENPTLDDLVHALEEGSVEFLVPLLPDEEPVPAHFHVTEVARIQKDFIDCGGTERHLLRAQLQVLVANDFDHRLAPEKLLKILRLSAPILGDEPLPLTMEYGRDVAVSYPVSSLETRGAALLFRLEAPVTACLAPDSCGLEPEPPRREFVRAKVNACAPGSGCC